MKTYKDKLGLVEQRHLEAVKQLIPVAHQSQLLSLVKKSCNEIEDICNGIFLLRELTAPLKRQDQQLWRMDFIPDHFCKIESRWNRECVERCPGTDCYQFKFYCCRS